MIGLVIAYLHPFHLVMPWQTGEASEVNDAMLEIMGDTGFAALETDWGRTTPLNHVAATGVFEGEDDPALACSRLRLALDEWGVVTEIERREAAALGDWAKGRAGH